MTVKEIIKEWLIAKGYDGLYHPGDCGCNLEDLMACSEDCADCEPAYAHYAKEDSEHYVVLCGIKTIDEMEEGHCIGCDFECEVVK
jgi:hypothetical protein